MQIYDHINAQIMLIIIIVVVITHIIDVTLCGELFRQVLHNRMRVLHQLLSPVKETPYGLRPSSHNRIIPRADNRFRRNFIIRMLYK